MYKVSKYISELKFKNQIFLLSNLKSSILKLHDPKYIDEYLTIKEKGFINSPQTELESVLISSGFYVEKEEDVLSKVKNIYSQMDETLIITILPTEKCNFRCKYCYEDFKVDKMPLLYIKAIKMFIKEKIESKKYKYMYLSWFGGEPLLAMDVIEDIQQFVVDLCEVNNIILKSSITTNGYLLDSDLFKKLLLLKIRRFQITIDGELHDQKRVLISGKGTYKKIIDNLKTIQLLNDDFFVVLRNNILKGQFDKKYYDELSTFIANDSRFSVFIHVVGDWGGTNEPSKLNLLSENNEIRDNFYQHFEYLVERKINVHNFNSGFPFGSICYATYKSSYVFRANGDVCKCTVHLDMLENNIGKIINEDSIIFDNDKLKYWSKDRLDIQCHKCKYLLACMNKSCPAKAKKNHINCCTNVICEI